MDPDSRHRHRSSRGGQHAASNDTCAAERACARGQNVVRGRLGAHAKAGAGATAMDVLRRMANMTGLMYFFLWLERRAKK